ncbi:MAG: hypothetical protein D3924_15415 [Candidatus Electrothrix sp. AR4]|nr:hypothetical protein [Candidatus Electrothrix sp. AR4]
MPDALVFAKKPLVFFSEEMKLEFFTEVMYNFFNELSNQKRLSGPFIGDRGGQKYGNTVRKIGIRNSLFAFSKKTYYRIRSCSL